jgi:hypothetical protein
VNVNARRSNGEHNLFPFDSKIAVKLQCVPITPDLVERVLGVAWLQVDAAGVGMAAKLRLKCSGNEPGRFCGTFGGTPDLAARRGDMHVSWVAFPNDAEEQCSPHRFATPARHAYRHQQNNHRNGSTSRRFGVTVPFGMSLIATNIQVCDKSF